MSKTEPKIVVVGAGIVGASVACHLARRGAAVTIVEQNCPAGGVTGKAFAWINVSHGTAGTNAALRLSALAEYRRLQDELGGALPIDWCGALTWSDDPQDSERMVRDHAARGYDIRLVERAEIAALEPGLTAPPPCAAFAPGEGGIDPIAATDILVRAARAAGAEVRLSTPAWSLAADDARVTGIVTAAGTIAADHVVLTAGLGIASLCEPLGLKLPIEASPAILLRLQSDMRLVRHILSTPAFEIRQPATATVLAAADYIDDSAANGPPSVAARALAAMRAGLRGADGLTLTEAIAGIRPIPADGLPIVGAAPGIAGLYVAVMHAGIVLAPVVGRLATEELLEGRSSDRLAACRPARFGGAR